MEPDGLCYLVQQDTNGVHNAQAADRVDVLVNHVCGLYSWMEQALCVAGVKGGLTLNSRSTQGLDDLVALIDLIEAVLRCQWHQRAL